MEEERLLTTGEVLLLENLMYLPETAYKGLQPLKMYEGRTVGDLVHELGVKCMGPEGEGQSGDGTRRHMRGDHVSDDFGLCMTRKDWDDLFCAILGNEMLMRVNIEIVYRDTASGGKGGQSALFLNLQSGEAIVAFGGTAQGEWKDNFQGGGRTDAFDQVSTGQQLQALGWYQSLCLEPFFVTTAGHSKGGNKAKYIAILEDSVDRCLSFDGQGFSDEFMDRYYARIMLRQHVIENHNLEKDYVNLLLEDVGEVFWYKGRNYGRGEFLKNHCPIAFFSFEENGSWGMPESETGQVDALKKIDRFVTDFLRSLSGREKSDMLDLLGTLAENYALGATKEWFLVSLLAEKNRNAAASLAEYSLSYEMEHPEFARAVEWVLDESGLGSLIWAVRVIRAMLAG